MVQIPRLIDNISTDGRTGLKKDKERKVDEVEEGLITDNDLPPLFPRVQNTIRGCYILFHVMKVHKGDVFLFL